MVTVQLDVAYFGAAEILPGILAWVREGMAQRGDPEWAAEHIYEVAEDACPGQELADAGRCMDVDKAWDGISFLLRAAGGAPAPVSDEDLGYGPARCLKAGQVREAAGCLAVPPWERLAGHFDAARMRAEGACPAIWGNEADLDYLRHNYHDLVAFFGFAAAAGDGVILWLT